MEPEIISVIHDNCLHLNFVPRPKDSCSYLVEKQQTEKFYRDLREASEYFSELASNDDTHFSMYVSPQLILDGAACFRFFFQVKNQKGLGKLVVFQDVNAASENDDDKATMLWACTCNDDNPGNCMAHGLYDRAKHIFVTVKKLRAAPGSYYCVNSTSRRTTNSLPPSA